MQINIRFIFVFVVTLFANTVYSEEALIRKEIAVSLSQAAIDTEVKVSFSVDPNDDTTLVIHRISHLKPAELAGNWKIIYLMSIGAGAEELKKQGFDKARIYTSQSEDISDYVLKVF